MSLIQDFLSIFPEASKTEEDVAKEGRILREMLEIVERRDSLIALMEADRQRCPQPSEPVFPSSFSFADPLVVSQILLWFFVYFLLIAHNP